MKKNKAIVPITENIVIPLSPTAQEQKQYFKDRYDELEEIEKATKEIRNELRFLREFRSLLSGHCIIHNVKKTIIQCTVSINKGNCNFYKQCIERKRYDELTNQEPPKV